MSERFRSDDFTAGDQRSYQHAQNAMAVDVLPREQQVRYLRAMMHTRGRPQRDVLGNAIHASTLRTGVVAIGQRRAGLVAFNLRSESGKFFFHSGNQSLGMLFFESLIVGPTMPHAR